MRASSSLVALLFCYVGHGYAHLFMILYPTTVLGLGQVFDMPYDQLLALATPGFIAFGAGSIPAAWLGQKWSAKGMLGVFFIGTGLAAIATAYAETPWQLGAGLTMIGIFASIYHPVGINVLVANAHNLGKALGVNGMSGNLGTAAGPVVAGTLMVWMDWRFAFIIPGIISVLTGILFLMIVSGEQAAQDSKPHRIAREISKGELMRVFTFLGIATLCVGIIYNASTIALPKLFAERLEGLADNPAEIGFWVTVIFGIAAIAQLWVGHLIDKHHLKPIYIAIFLLQAPLLYVVAIMQGNWLLLIAGLMAFCNIGGVPLGDALIARYSSEQWRSTIYGVKFVLALGVSAIGVPLVAIMYATTGGLSTLFMLLSGMALLTALAAFLLPNEKKYQKAAVMQS